MDGEVPREQSRPGAAPPRPVNGQPSALLPPVDGNAEAASGSELRDLLDRLRGTQRRTRQRLAVTEAESAAKSSRIRSLENAVEEVQQRERLLRQQIDRLRDDLRRERGAALLAMRQAEATRGTISFRLGRAFLDASNSISGAIALPRRILALHRETKKREQARGPSYVPEADIGLDGRRLIDRLHAGGVAAARRLIDELANGDDRRRAALLSELSRIATALDPKGALAAAEQAYQADPRPFRAKWLAFQLARHGAIDRPAGLLEGLPLDELGHLRPSERVQLNRIRGLHRLKHQDPPVPTRAAKVLSANPRRVFYIVASALPDHVSGYTRRTHALVRAARVEGWDVKLLTRAGYPGDRTDRVDDALAAAIDLQGVLPERLAGPSLAVTPLDQWVGAAAAAIEARARAHRPAVIQAASNWLNALPALIAARRLGLPFVYEVRGFWELTRAARQPSWSGSEEHEMSARYEAMIARTADRVVTHSERLAEELERRGVARGCIALAPNGAEPLPRAAESVAGARAALGLAADRFVVGYLGSIVDYEGLDDLVRALALLVAQGLDVEAVIAGDGNARPMVAALAVELGLGERVKMPGTLAPDLGPKLFAAVDAVVLPRKSFAVTELVEPLKPLEAMAAGRPLIASDIGPLRDIVRHRENGLLHQPSDPDDLALQLRSLMQDPALAQTLGEAGRRFVETERSWAASSRREIAVWEEVLAAAARPRPAVPAVVAPLEVEATAPVATEEDEIAEPVPLPRRQSRFTPEQRQEFLERAAVVLARDGLTGAIELVERQSRGRSTGFIGLCFVLAAQAARRAERFFEEAALLERAIEAAPGPMSWRALARALWYRGDVGRAREFLEHVETAEGEERRPETIRLRRLIEQRAELIALGDDVVRHYSGGGEPMAEIDPGKAVYFLHFTLPYASNGYATRSHGLLKAMRASGFDVVAYSRSGFPYDMPAFRGASGFADEDRIDGVVYRRIFEGSRVAEPELDYILNSAQRYEQVIRRERAAIVHAASNFTTGLAALIAARRLGLPFIYEARGFWEMTRASRQSDFESHPQFHLIQSLEALVAREADRVITLTDGMRDDFIARGAAAERVSVVANAVDPERFRPLLREDALGNQLGLPSDIPVIGYVGSVVGYEGLDDLVEACALLRRDGLDFRLLLVGDGAAMPELRSLIEARGLANCAVMPGRVAHDEVESYYSLIDICPFPRKPLPLCELVSPLKPFEALAMEKAIIVSSVRALTEIVEEGATGLVFQKGDPIDLRRALATLLANPELRARLGRGGREWIASRRTWKTAGDAILGLYRELISAHPPIADAAAEVAARDRG